MTDLLTRDVYRLGLRISQDLVDKREKADWGHYL